MNSLLSIKISSLIYIMNKCYSCDLVITSENIGEICNFCNNHICEFCFEKVKEYLNLRYGFICVVCSLK